MNQSDEQLLALALGGDGACFGELTQRWQRKIFTFVCRYVGNVEEARDLTQDTFTKAYQNLDRLTDPSRFSSWLYKIALNECRMRFRRHRHINHVALDDTNESEAIEIVDDSTTPEQNLAEKERASALRAAFGALPEEQRVVILMKEYQDLKFHEISEIMNIPLSTVKSRMYLGLKTLKRLMEKRI
ncbi:MAG: sigma-70 family RNA polymerase sigma factor [Acidobacteria bacterium]|nr:MAG: sigma-70 family RNA polymerase sigma factor [Acidobacteriota bacterium]